MPIGYLITVGVAASWMLVACAPARGRYGRASWWLGMVISESPFVLCYWVLAATVIAAAQGDLDSPLGWIGGALTAMTLLGGALIVRRSLRARSMIEHALDDALGTTWDGRRMSRAALPWGRILVFPIPFARRNVERVANLSYGDAGRFNQLDLYRRRGRDDARPILIHLHGGGFAHGRKSFEARPLMLGLARNGWICISANYRLRPAATFAEMVTDAKQVIAWARAHATEHGGDPERIFIAGSSAGAHLAATAALTANDAVFQPGFEAADTSVAGAICLYGYYGPLARTSIPSAPIEYAHPDSPAILIAHGWNDTLVPPDRARQLAERLRMVSTSPVVYVELPGAQHSFDIVHSIRFETLIAGIETFADCV